MPGEEVTPPNEEIEIGVRLAAVQTIEFVQHAPTSGQISVDELQYTTGANFRIREEDSAIYITITVEVWFEHEQQRTDVGKIVTISRFDLMSLEPLRSDEGFSIPGQMLTSLISVCVSTTRGILLTTARDSIMNQHPMPLVNPQQMVAGMTNRTQE